MWTAPSSQGVFCLAVPQSTIDEAAPQPAKIWRDPQE
jgi:hypothetical protein